MIAGLLASVPMLYRWLALALFAVGLVGYGYVKGLHHGEADLDAFRARVESVGQAQQTRTAVVVAAQKQITLETSDAWAQNLDAVRRYAADQRLRDIAGAGCGAVPAVPGSAGGADGAASDARPTAAESSGGRPGSDMGQSVSIGRAPLAERCAVTTLQLVTLQAWVRRQEAATNGPRDPAR